MKIMKLFNALFIMAITLMSYSCDKVTPSQALGYSMAVEQYTEDSLEYGDELKVDLPSYKDGFLLFKSRMNNPSFLTAIIPGEELCTYLVKISVNYDYRIDVLSIMKNALASYSHSNKYKYPENIEQQIPNLSSIKRWETVDSLICEHIMWCLYLCDNNPALTKVDYSINKENVYKEFCDYYDMFMKDFKKATGVSHARQLYFQTCMDNVDIKETFDAYERLYFNFSMPSEKDVSHYKELVAKLEEDNQSQPFKK